MDAARSSDIVVGERTAANCIYQADSRDLKVVEDGVVDLIICSPPYNHEDTTPID